MNYDWQLISALLAVGSASGYLVYRLRQLIYAKNNPSCGGCSKCSSETTKKLPLVSSDSLKDSLNQH